LLWILNGHYRAMLCARSYASDPLAHRLLAPSHSALHHPDSPIEPSGAVVVDGNWGPHLDAVLPKSPRFVPISCVNGGRRISRMTFGGEREMAQVLHVKDRTRGRSTDLLGARNVHAGVPKQLLSRGADHGCVLVARDRLLQAPGTNVRLAVLDVLQAILNQELPRKVTMVPSPAPSPLHLRRPHRARGHRAP